MVRITLSRLLLIFFTIILIKLLFHLNKENFQFTCNRTENYIKNLENLLQKVHVILENAKLTHILCYGTLWGQIRISKILPWSSKGEFCIFDDELETLDKIYFNDIFTRNGLNIRYDKIDGFYTIEDDFSEINRDDNIGSEDGGSKEDRPIVEIYIFKLDQSQDFYKRVGLLRRVLPPTCDWTPSLHCFPANLIEKPLPKKILGNYEYSVPMGGAEIQKYHYAENWWKEVPIKNC